jgi:hypothetical protein
VTGYAHTAGGTIDERLRLRVLDAFGELEGETGDRQEILYVLTGSGTLELGASTARSRRGRPALPVRPTR